MLTINLVQVEWMEITDWTDFLSCLDNPHYQVQPMDPSYMQQCGATFTPSGLSNEMMRFCLHHSLL